jgi:hypothetical protein
MDWIGQNWLAAYGAVIGTLAFALNYLRYQHSVREKRIKLSVKVSKHPDHDNNIKLLTEPAGNPWIDPTTCMEPIFRVEVRNLGAVDAYLQSVGIIDLKGARREALVRTALSASWVLHPVSETTDEPIKPKSSRTYEVFLSRGETPFSVRTGYVEDQLGIFWHSRRYREDR